MLPTPRSPVQSKVVLSTATFVAPQAHYTRLSCFFQVRRSRWACVRLDFSGGVETNGLSTAFLRLQQLSKGRGQTRPADSSLERENLGGRRYFQGTFQGFHASYNSVETYLICHLKEILRILPHCNYHLPFQSSIIPFGQFRPQKKRGCKDKKEDAL